MEVESREVERLLSEEQRRHLADVRFAFRKKLRLQKVAHPAAIDIADTYLYAIALKHSNGTPAGVTPAYETAALNAPTVDLALVWANTQIDAFNDRGACTARQSRARSRGRAVPIDAAADAPTPPVPLKWVALLVVVGVCGASFVNGALMFIWIALKPT
jgi:hypothetical protein|tara:strand:- start:1007 stop:1483 length:477 start_codon:yes stop_codon:yes gene_type:complete